jgi:hypothetical protein
MKDVVSLTVDSPTSPRPGYREAGIRILEEEEPITF